MASWRTYIEVTAQVLLLFFFIPVQYKGPDEIEVENKFQDFLKNFNKSYEDPEIYQQRLAAFHYNLETIEKLNLNRTEGSATYGITKFSDMFPEEFLKHHLKANLTLNSAIRRNHVAKRSVLMTSDIPRKIDWRSKKVISKVKNQRNCGACWAFSAVETIESIYALKTGKLEELSVQQLIDCAGYNNKGCDGGDTCNLLMWLKDYGIHLQKESDYPYNLKTGKCKRNSTLTEGPRIKDFACENLIGFEHGLLDLIAKHGPVAVAVNAKTWQNYIGGVIQFHCDGNASQLSHAVQLVGYDLDAKIPHYIARNTWGEDFGDKGYLYLAIGKNICGLAYEVSALVVH